MNDKNQINELMQGLIENVKSVIDVNTVIGEAIVLNNGIRLVPITRVGVGFVSGGGEYGCDKKIIKNMDKMPLAGGGGGGVSISPIGFLEIKNNSCKLIRIDEKSVYQNILDKIPSILEGVSSIINKGDKSKNDK